MIVIDNNPIVSEAFQSEEVKDFFRSFLMKLGEPYTLRAFLKDGVDKTYEDQLAQLAKSFIPFKNVANEEEVFEEVVRCIDGVHFKLGDLVIDKEAPDQPALPISRMYEDDRGLHVQLLVDKDKWTITWRDLSQIESDDSLPF